MTGAKSATRFKNYIIIGGATYVRANAYRKNDERPENSTSGDRSAEPNMKRMSEK